MMLVWLLLAAGCSLVLTGLVRRYALAHQLIDEPNARSSHFNPTPRGGGLAIVLVFLVALLLLGISGLTAWSLVWALVGSGALVAMLGFVDDHGHVPVMWRLSGHFLAAAWLLVWLGGLPPFALFGGVVIQGPIGQVLAAVYLVWLLNLYNFMDGIDGIASLEAICVCLVGGGLLWAAGYAQQAWPPLFLAFSVVGFLYWNLPSARIFMGDVGSGFLGLVLGGFSINVGWAAPELFWGWLILLGVFIVDASWTLFRRLLQGERVYEAHRRHAYQLATRSCGGHLPVVVAVVAINLLWLAPIAAWVVLGGLPGLWGVCLAYTPLVLLAWKLKAGGPLHSMA